jgi:AraC-like DNA-binding protein
VPKSLQIEAIAADPALFPALRFYYRLRQPYSYLEDHLRGDCGQIRLFLSGGNGQVDWVSHSCPCLPFLLTGPVNHSPRVRIAGPLDFIGFPLMPEAWGQLLHADASDFADRAVDADTVLGAGWEGFRDLLPPDPDMRQIADRLDALLLTRLRPLPPSHIATIATIRRWIAHSPFPVVDDLYACCAMTSRQVMRIANRYFGAPPKLLARKYGALRTASHILLNAGRAPADATSHYADQSHMIRDIRQFTGQTPLQLMSRASPIMRETLHPQNFGEIAPYA